MAHDINITIDKAKIEGYSVELRENLPHIEVNIGLYCGDKKITSFRAYDKNCCYHSEIKFPISTKIIKDIQTIAQTLENAVMVEQNKDLLRLKG